MKRFRKAADKMAGFCTNSFQNCYIQQLLLLGIYDAVEVHQVAMDQGKSSNFLFCEKYNLSERVSP